MRDVICMEYLKIVVVYSFPANVTTAVANSIENLLCDETGADLTNLTEMKKRDLFAQIATLDAKR